MILNEIIYILIFFTNNKKIIKINKKIKKIKMVNHIK